jgi:hypothetical protein
MNKEHYRLESLKLAAQIQSVNTHQSIREVAEILFQWIIQDEVNAEHEKKFPPYKELPNPKLQPRKNK